MAAQQQISEAKSRLIASLTAPALQARATEGKCIARKRDNISLCRNDARPDSLYCATHRH